MNNVILSLNFMYCMERLATQIYLTQRGAFSNKELVQQLTDASANEHEHVEKLRKQIKQLDGSVYPLGFIFQSAGCVLGLITRILGKRTLFKSDVFVEKRAVKDYAGFLKSVPFDAATAAMLRGIIADEEVHITNWQKASERKKY